MRRKDEIFKIFFWELFDTWYIEYSQEAKKGDTEKQIKYLEQRLNLEFGTFQLTRAYEEAINYPFRPGAVKAVVGIFASPCEKSPLPLSVSFYLWSLLYHY